MKLCSAQCCDGAPGEGSRTCAAGAHFFCDDLDDAATSAAYTKLHVDYDGAVSPLKGVIGIESDASWSPPSALGIAEPAHGLELVADYWQRSFGTTSAHLVASVSNPAPNAFERYQIVVDEIGRHATLSIGDAPAASIELSPSDTPITTVALELGAPALIGPLPAVDYQLDDVTLDLQ